MPQDGVCYHSSQRRRAQRVIHMRAAARAMPARGAMVSASEVARVMLPSRLARCYADKRAHMSRARRAITLIDFIRFRLCHYFADYADYAYFTPYYVCRSFAAADADTLRDAAADMRVYISMPYALHAAFRHFKDIDAFMKKEHYFRREKKKAYAMPPFSRLRCRR